MSPETDIDSSPRPSTTTPHGATPGSDSQTQFRVWASRAKQVDVEIVQRLENKQESDRRGNQETVVATHRLTHQRRGVFAATVNDCPAGTLYRYRLDGKPGRPDPYSRFQPFGVHGPSQVVDSESFNWTDQLWDGVQKKDLVVYELHIGSFTSEGTYQSAIEKLDELKSLGITAIELLPLVQTPGKWNWGYDGVNFFAPRNTFGSPDDLKQFINACHEKQIAVVLDVVYNHVGPEGNYLNEFSTYRSPKHGTPWGDSLNFDGRGNALVREFVVDNVLFWIDEYHFDGLRLDAIHYMFDDSKLSIVDEIQQRFREYQNTIDRTTYLIAESNIYDSHLVGDVEGGEPNYDAIWSDCLMHSLYSHGDPELRLTNRHYQGTPDFVEALEHAYVFSFPQAVRVDDLLRDQHHPSGDRQYIGSLVMALQTHDSVGNHPHGKRLHQLTSFEFQKSAAPLFLLYPSIPMIFMGEEWATDAPFPFFADFEDPRLRKAVDKGRRDEYPHHAWGGSPLPSDPAAFLSSKLTPDSLHPEMFGWYQQILKFRRRGIEDGWLNIDYKTTDCDLKDNIFRLMFRGHDGSNEKRIVICSRLAKADEAPIKIEFGTPVEVHLNSEKVTDATPYHTTEIELKAQHCCVWIEGM